MGHRADRRNKFRDQPRIVVTDASFSQIAKAIPRTVPKDRLVRLREEIEYAANVARTLKPGLHPSPSDFLERLDSVARSANDLITALAGEEIQVPEQEVTLSLKDGRLLKFTAKAAWVPTALARVLIPFIARDMGHEGSETAQMLGRILGASSSSYDHLDAMLADLVTLRNWCREASQALKNEHTRQPKKLPRNADALMLLESLGEIWKKVTGDEARMNALVTGEMEGPFVDFAKSTGEGVGIPITDSCLRTCVRAWRQGMTGLEWTRPVRQ
jgi:hypothetical protein